jgi:hypothetical protein
MTLSGIKSLFHLLEGEADHVIYVFVHIRVSLYVSTTVVTRMICLSGQYGLVVGRTAGGLLAALLDT